MKHLRIASCALVALGFANGAAAATAGTLLFAQTGTQIVGATGATRPASKGDVLQTGERLLTPAGAISQVLLPDGSLLGMRSESELKIDAAPAGADSKAPTVTLVSGAARVIGAELMDGKKVSNFTLQSGTATVKLKAADLESAVVKAGGSDVAPGSYQRLLVGSGSVTNGNLVATLAPRQVSFVGTANAAPMTLNNGSAQNLFAGSRGTTPSGSDKGATTPATFTPPKLVNIAVLPRLTAPPPTPVVVPITAPVVKPCTRFIGKTCIQ